MKAIQFLLTFRFNTPLNMWLYLIPMFWSVFFIQLSRGNLYKAEAFVILPKTEVKKKTFNFFHYIRKPLSILALGLLEPTDISRLHHTLSLKKENTVGIVVLVITHLKTKQGGLGSSASNQRSAELRLTQCITLIEKLRQFIPFPKQAYAHACMCCDSENPTALLNIFRCYGWTINIRIRSFTLCILCILRRKKKFFKKFV